MELQSGKHEVRLTSPGHYDWEAQVQLNEKEETPLAVHLIPETSDTGAAIPQARENNISQLSDTAPAAVEDKPKGTGPAKSKTSSNDLDEMIRDLKYK